MGQLISATYNTYWGAPDTSPDIFSDPKYDHSHGFPRERKKRSTYSTEMSASGYSLPLVPLDGVTKRLNLCGYALCGRIH